MSSHYGGENLVSGWVTEHGANHLVNAGNGRHLDIGYGDMDGYDSRTQGVSGIRWRRALPMEIGRQKEYEEDTC